MARPDADPLLRCDRLSIGFVDADGRAVEVVREAGWSLKPGESLGIVGESGSGKSTLARALLGYLRGGGRFMGGSLWLGGVDMTRAGAGELSRLRGLTVAMVPQNPLASLTYHIPVGRQVEEVLLTRKGLTRARARAATLRLFEELDLPDPAAIARRYPHQLSGGQRQRIVIAAALACEPNLIVLDEPTTALDKTTESQVLALVQRIREARKAALVLVTHDLNVVAHACERVLVMKDGRIVEQGQTAEIFALPRHAYTRELLSHALDISGAAPPLVGDADLLVEARGLGFTYGSGGWFARRSAAARATLAGVDFTVGRGEVVGVIGESGSGKSTLGLMLAGLLAPDEGRLQLEGRSIAMTSRKRNAELRRRIQIVFQDPLSSLNPRQTVATAVARPLRLFFGLSARAARDRTAELFAALGLAPELMSRYPRQLSGGQQQRVAIARAFAAEPDLLVCDEITSALDASVQGQVLDALEAMRARRGASALLITHDLAVIWRMAGRVIVLKDGRIVEHGPTKSVFSQPADPYTASLLLAATRATAIDRGGREPSEPEPLRNAS